MWRGSVCRERCRVWAALERSEAPAAAAEVAKPACRE